MIMWRIIYLSFSVIFSCHLNLGKNSFSVLFVQIKNISLVRNSSTSLTLIFNVKKA